MLRRPHRAIFLLAAAATLAVVASSPTAAATRTWTGLGLTNNWNDALNWSGGVVPGAADIATFDATSSKNATLNVAVNVGGLSIGGGYAGTITQAGNTVTVGATGLTQSGGTFAGGTATITVNGPFVLSAGSFTATTATLSIAGNFTDGGGAFAASSGTVSFGGGAATLTMTTADTFNNLTLAAGTKTVAAGTTLTATGATTLTAGALNGTGTLAAQGAISQALTYAGGTASLLINGAGAQTFTGAATTAAGDLPVVAINKPSGTLTLAGTIRTTHSWTYTAGSLDPGTSTLVFAGGTITGSHTLNAVDVRGTTTIAAGTTLTVGGSLSLTGGTFNTGTLAAQGSISQTSAFANGTATLLINGTAAQTFTGAATTAAGDLPAVVINKPSGTLTLAGTIRTTHNWTYTAGTVDPAASTVVFAGAQTITGSQTLADVVINNTTVHTVAAGDTLTVTGTLTLADGSIATGTMAALGAISQASAFDGGAGTLLINGAAGQTFTGAATPTVGLLPVVVVNKSGGTLTLAGTIRTASNWTYTAGTLDAGGSTVVFAGGTITGSHSLNIVDFRATTSIAAGTTLTVTGSTALTSGALNGTGTLAAQGDISETVNSTGGTATLLINGSGGQTFTGAATTAGGDLPLLVINKPSGTLTLAGTIRTTHNWTYTAGTVDAGTSTLLFAGGTITGSHSLNIVDFRATTSIAAGTTLTANGSTTLTAGSLNGTGSLAAKGDISQVLGYGGGAATLLINGTAAQAFTGAATTVSGNLPVVVINKPSGTLTLAGTIRTASSWTYTAGTLDPGTSTLVFAGGTITGSHSLNIVDFRATTSIAAGTTLTANGSTTLTAGSLNGTGSLAAKGDISQVLGYGGGAATLLINGTAAQAFTGAATTVSGNLPVVVINKPSGTLTLAGTIRTASSWTYTAGTLDPGTSTLVFAGGTITGSHSLNIVDFRATTSIAAGTTLTATGMTTLTSGNLNGTGTLAAQGAISQASTNGGGTATLLINGTAAQTFTGAATTAAGNLPLLVINKPSGILTLAGTIRTASSWTYIAGTIDAGASTVVFAGTQTISGSHTLADVVVNNTTVHTIPGPDTLTVTGLLTLADGSIGTGTLAAQGAISQAAAFDGGTGTLLVNGVAAQTFTGTATAVAGQLPLVVINKPSGTLTLAGTIRTPNNWTYIAGTVDAGASTIVFAGGTVTSVGMAFHDVTANGGTTTLGSAMAVGHDLTVASGTLTTSPSGYGLTIVGNLLVSSTFRANASAVAIGGNLADNGTIVPGTSTVTMNGSAGQTIGGLVTTPLYNLVVVDALGVTLTGNLTVSGTLTLASGQLSLGANLLTISNAIAGTPTNLIGGATSSLTVTGSGAGISVPSSVTLLSALTVNNANGLALHADVTVGATLTLTTGRLDAAGSTMVMGPGASVIRTSGWVVGRLQKQVPAGLAVGLGFEIGDGASYTPVAVSFGTVTTPGGLTAVSTGGDHPDVASSGIAVGQSVNRWWTITNSGITFDSYAATFNFVAGDIDPGADPTAFIVAKDDASTWTRPTVGTRAALSTQATGMTSFSDFEIGEATADLGIGVSDGLASVTAGDGLSHGYLITVTNAGPSDATGVSLADTWPAAFSQGTLSPSQGTCAPVGAGPDFSCDLGTIAAGGSATVSVAYTVAASTPGGIATESVSVTSSVVDPSPSDDTATDTTTIVESALLVVTKDDGQSSVFAGDGVAYSYLITITNSGPSDADNLVLDDAVPGALSVGSPGADLAGDCSGSIANAIHCSLPAALAPGFTWTITVPYSVGASTPGQTVTNMAVATSDENLAGVTAGDTTTIVSSADLGIGVSDGLASVTAGDGLSHGYLITVTNAGPSDATGVSLADTWPAAFSQGTLSPSQGTCAPVGAGPDFSCDLGTIAAGGSATVSVAYTVAASTPGGIATESVSVTSSVVDPSPGDDTATDTTTIVESALLGEGPPDTSTLGPKVGDDRLANAMAALLAATGTIAALLLLTANRMPRRWRPNVLIGSRRRR